MKKTIIITGADGGMGTEISREAARKGYHVVMLCRTREGGEERKSQLIQETGNTDLEVFPVELSSMKAVADTADKLLARTPSIDLLMNNAGTMSPHFIQTEDGLNRPQLSTTLLLTC